MSANAAGLTARLATSLSDFPTVMRHRQRMPSGRWPLIVLSVMVAGLLGPQTLAATEWLTGTEFHAALDQPVTSNWEQIELERLIATLSTGYRTAVIVDRRLDPHRPVSLSVRSISLRDTWQALARTVDAEAAVLSSVVYLGPADRARWLRTAIAQIEADVTRIPAAQRGLLSAAMSRRLAVAWPAATEPRAMLVDLQQRLSSSPTGASSSSTRTVKDQALPPGSGRPPSAPAQRSKGPAPLLGTGLESVPYDLWRPTRFPQSTIIEAATVILAQCDRRLVVETQPPRLEIEAWQPPPLLERTYAPLPGRSLTETAAAWQELFPGSRVEAVGAQLRLAGRVEDHEQLQSMFKSLRDSSGNPRTTSPAVGATPIEPGQSPPNATAKTSAAGPDGKTLPPLQKRLLTLKVERVPAVAILQELSKTGIQFRYDEAALKAAGIDLQREVTLDVTRVAADKFFQALLGPLGAAATLDAGTIVTITPAPK